MHKDVHVCVCVCVVCLFLFSKQEMAVCDNYFKCEVMKLSSTLSPVYYTHIHNALYYFAVRVKHYIFTLTSLLGK